MKKLSLSKKTLDMNLSATSDKTLSLKDCAGEVVVIYFYPKDSTPWLYC